MDLPLTKYRLPSKELEPISFKANLRSLNYLEGGVKAENELTFRACIDTFRVLFVVKRPHSHFLGILFLVHQYVKILLSFQPFIAPVEFKQVLLFMMLEKHVPVELIQPVVNFNEIRVVVLFFLVVWLFLAFRLVSFRFGGLHPKNIVKNYKDP